MAAEQSDLEKTEPASARRLEKAREEGNVARSRELSTLVMVGSAVGGLWFMAGSLGMRLEQVMRAGLQFGRGAATDPAQMLARAGATAAQALLAVAPLLLLMAAAALVAPTLLGGWLFSMRALAPRSGKLNPAAGIARMFSMQALVELLKALAKSVLIGGVAAWVIAHNLDRMMGLMALAPRAALTQAVMLVARDCALIAATLVLVALIDAPWQLWNHQRKLRMSREDLRQEHKESEGDPQIKAQIRRQQQAVARRRMMAQVLRADIVLTNPTHFAVALKYDDHAMRAPRVVAKGAELVALRIRELAAGHGVPVLEAPPLTRALYRHTRLDDEIPAALYTAVAEVLAWVYRLKRWRAEGGEPPRAPADLPVPQALADGRAVPA